MQTNTAKKESNSSSNFVLDYKFYEAQLVNEAIDSYRNGAELFNGEQVFSEIRGKYGWK